MRSSYRAEQALAGNNAGLDNAPQAHEPQRCTSPAAPAAARVALPRPLIRWLGRVEYEPTWRAMQRFTDERDAATADEMWLLEHPPVFTLGMNASRAHVLAPGQIPGACRSIAAGR